MWASIFVWLKGKQEKLFNSIAFYPAIIGLLFLVISILIISFDLSDKGQGIKSQLSWLSLKDASTARSIIAAIAAGIISLTVFSFSMVMIVLNQTASQMSNRILDNLIGSRFQQLVLGVYIGTIVYAFALLSTIRDTESALQIPTFSTYFLILLTIFDIFLFIYFLHYITQSVKYEVIINRIYKETRSALEKSCSLVTKPAKLKKPGDNYPVAARVSGTYEGFSTSALIHLCDKHECEIRIFHAPGTFLLEGMPVAGVNKKLPDEVMDEIGKAMYLPSSESISENYYFGLRQLTEVAIKAMSPGINDPGTAIQSLRALFRLLSYRLKHYPLRTEKNKEGKILIRKKEPGFEQIFNNSVLPVWDYARKDRLVRQEMELLLVQLQDVSSTKIVRELLKKVRKQVAGGD